MNNRKITTLHKIGTNISTELGQVLSYPVHIHSYYEMLLYEPFDGYVCVNDQVIIPDNPTSVLIIPGDFHEVVVNGKSKSKYMKLSFTSNIFEKANFIKASMLLKAIGRDSLFFKIYSEIIKNSDNEQLKKALTQVILCLIMQNGQMITTTKSIDTNKYSSEAVRIINEKYDDDLTLSEVAKLVSITPQYLSNTFKSNIGITFSNYLTVIRLQHAERLLIETTESVTDICDMCGYKNFSHFIRSFKKTYGTSPSIYRKSRITLSENKLSQRLE